jgi:hypothetical protein
MSDINEEYQKNTKEQYEVLGRFVEAFETMVNEVREDALDLLERDGRHRRLIAIVLHHQVFSAKPLYDVYRATVIEIIDNQIRLQEAKQKAKEDGIACDKLDIELLGRPFTVYGERP